jgi:hypothetical protein
MDLAPSKSEVVRHVSIISCAGTSGVPSKVAQIVAQHAPPTAVITPLDSCQYPKAPETWVNAAEVNSRRASGIASGMTHA